LPSSPNTAPWTTLYPFGEKTQGQKQVHQGHSEAIRKQRLAKQYIC
jgi:hypothetical protein